MIFGILEFADQPVNQVVGISVAQVTVEVEVVLIAEIGVERYEAEPAVGGCAVGAVVVADRGQLARGQPRGPVLGKVVVKPLEVST